MGNHASWPTNPHLLLQVSDRPVQMEIMLQQDLGRDDASTPIGFCITESNEQGYPKIKSVDDIIVKVNYEEGRDISLRTVLQPSPTPYVITPSTFEPGVKR